MGSTANRFAIIGAGKQNPSILCSPPPRKQPLPGMNVKFPTRRVLGTVRSVNVIYNLFFSFLFFSSSLRSFVQFPHEILSAQKEKGET